MSIIRDFKSDYNLLGFRYAARELFWSLFPCSFRLRADDLNNFLFPRQKWLYKKMPRFWIDKDKLLRICIFECIIHFVEEEKCFENTDYSWNEENETFARKLAEYYYWITAELKANEEKCVYLLSFLKRKGNWTVKSSHETKSIEEIRAEIKEIQDLIDLKETEIMLWAVINRRFLWT